MLEQSGNDVLKFAPNMHLRKDADGISFSAILITIQAQGSTREAGGQTVAIFTTLLTKETFLYTDAPLTGSLDMNLTLTTTFGLVWAQFFTDMCTQAGLLNTDYTVSTDPAHNMVVLNVYNLSALKLRQAVVQVEISK